ncbi:MAG TPA: hypothetical protein DCZ70_09120 [Alistipes sp.]|nr:hypothetical protein [Alistipes sp.]
MSAAKIGIFPVAANERDEPLRGSSRDAVAKRQGPCGNGGGALEKRAGDMGAARGQLPTA